MCLDLVCCFLRLNCTKLIVLASGNQLYMVAELNIVKYTPILTGVLAFISETRSDRPDYHPYPVNTGMRAKLKSPGNIGLFKDNTD